MSRNKFPEETIRLILDVSSRLFVEKGYDHTSIQDILHETKLSKGAIYHHFKSKEDIFIKIWDEIAGEIITSLSKIRDRQDLNGKDKLKAIFLAAFSDNNKKLAFDMAPNLLDNPRFLAMQIKEIYSIVAPDFIEPIINEGIRDGSIKAECPGELAEAIIILTNIWLNPSARPNNSGNVKNRVKVFNALLRGVGIELIDDKTLEDKLAEFT